MSSCHEILCSHKNGPRKILIWCGLQAILFSAQCKMQNMYAASYILCKSYLVEDKNTSIHLLLFVREVLEG